MIPARVLDGEDKPGAADRAGVADLPSRLGVERSPVKDKGNWRAGGRRRGGEIGELSLLEDADHGPRGLGRLIAEELGPMVIGLPECVERAGGEDVGGLGASPGDLAGLVLGRLEAGHIDPQVLVGRQAFGDLDGDAVGVVELERLAAVDRVGPAGLGPPEHVVDHPHAVFQVAQKPLFFLADDVLDSRHAVAELGVAAFHGLGHDRWQLVQERLALAHLIGVEHGPAQQAADDIPLLLRSRPDVFMDAEGQGADMIAGPADADAVERVLALCVVIDPQRLGRGGDDGFEDVDLEVRPHALKRRRGPFQAHAGIDVLVGQGLELTGADAVELGEDEVPDLDHFDPVAMIEDLGAGAADAVGAVRRSAGRPEVVVFSHPGDPVRGDAHLLVPDVEGLVVLEVDGEGQPVRRDLEHAGQSSQAQWIASCLK